MFPKSLICLFALFKFFLKSFCLFIYLQICTINNGINTLQCWEDNPDIYGIRRSSRARKEPERLNTGESDSSDIGKKKVVKKSVKRFVSHM